MSTPEPFEDSNIPTISGKWVVIALFIFGLCGAGTVWTYWKVTRAPFFELQKALAKSFPKSTPRVDGGKPKSGPMTISVVLHVDFPPDRDDPRVALAMNQVLDLAALHQDLTPYQVFEIYLIQKRPEQTILRLKATIQVSDLKNRQPGQLPTATYE